MGLPLYVTFHPHSPFSLNSLSASGTLRVLNIRGCRLIWWGNWRCSYSGRYQGPVSASSGCHGDSSVCPYLMSNYERVMSWGCRWKGVQAEAVQQPQVWRNVHPLASRLVMVGRRGEAVTAQGGGRVTTLASSSRLHGAVDIWGRLGGLEACNL